MSLPEKPGLQTALIFNVSTKGLSHFVGNRITYISMINSRYVLGAIPSNPGEFLATARDSKDAARENSGYLWYDSRTASIPHRKQ